MIKNTSFHSICTWSIFVLLFAIANHVHALPIQQKDKMTCEEQVARKPSFLERIIVKKLKKLERKQQKAMNKTETLAIVSPILGGLGILGWIASIAASFALSYVGLVLAIILGASASIAAIITGVIGLRHIQDDSNLQGRGLAIVGIVIGSLAALLFLVTSIGALLG